MPSSLLDHFKINVYNSKGSIVSQINPEADQENHLNSFDEKVIFDFSQLPKFDDIPENNYSTVSIEINDQSVWS